MHPRSNLLQHNVAAIKNSMKMVINPNDPPIKININNYFFGHSGLSSLDLSIAMLAKYAEVAKNAINKIRKMINAGIW